MTEYIFYTFEGECTAPNDAPIANCQLMGRAFGNNREEALKELLKENAWIEEYGYDPSVFVIRRLMPIGEDDKLW